ncbi:MAG: DUF305 domain-containing protein [Mycolicibacterium insubricum]|nr:DUF305 domain-containing protein [Mycobacterium sp.]
MRNAPRPLATRITALAGGTALAVALSACGGSAQEPAAGHDGHEHDHSATSVTSSTTAASPFNSADVNFVTMMIPHHAQAIELSGLVDGRSTNAELITLAGNVKNAQQPEIDTMKSMLRSWGYADDQADGNGHGGHGGHGTGMAGMVDDATMAKLKTLSGTDFDTRWLQSMIGHHEGAIEMARAEIGETGGGINPPAKQLAQSIITTQQAEIDQMKGMLGHG